jgi:hypothetical protein
MIGLIRFWSAFVLAIGASLVFGSGHSEASDDGSHQDALYLLADGTVVAVGEASSLGGVEGVAGEPVRIEPAADGPGYWILMDDGSVHGFGAAHYGDLAGVALDRPVVSIVSTRQGDGYWLVASDGGVFAFGAAAFHGSTGGVALDADVVALVPTSSGDGYWLVAADGGVFSFGAAPFLGSIRQAVPLGALDRPVIDAASSPGIGDGYLLLAGDGGIFAFGGSVFRGSVPALDLPGDPSAVGFAGSSGSGYSITLDTGYLVGFGVSTPFFADGPPLPISAAAIGAR